MSRRVRNRVWFRHLGQVRMKLLGAVEIGERLIIELDRDDWTSAYRVMTLVAETHDPEVRALVFQNASIALGIVKSVDAGVVILELQ